MYLNFMCRHLLKNDFIHFFDKWQANINAFIVILSGNKKPSAYSG